MLPKIWWIDDSDLYSAKNKINAVRTKQLTDWSWSRFCEDDHKSSSDAFESLLIEIGTKSMFDAGKVIVFNEIPSFQVKFSSCLDKISEGVLLIFVTKFDKTCSLVKRLLERKKSFEDKKEKDTFSLIEDKVVLTKDNAVDWITERASLFDLKIDKYCCKMLADFCEFLPNKITGELEKLKHVCIDKEVTPDLIMLSCFQVGNAEISEMCNAIMDNDGETSHNQLQRLIDAGNDGVKMCGYFMDLARKLAIAQDCNYEYKNREDDLSSLKKPEKQDDGSYKQIPMFPNIKALYYSCKSLRESEKPQGWTYELIYKIGKLQEKLRGEKGNESLLLHEFVSSLIV